MNTNIRYSDQAQYYFAHLEKQQKQMSNRLSILGRHHDNLNNFVREKVSQLKPKSKILDAGCGLSAWTIPALRKKYDIWGIDGEPEAIEVCKVIYKGQDYRVGDLYHLKYKPNSFDAVVMREVIEHFIFPDDAIKEVYKVLKPNGYFIITTPNYNSSLLHVIENTYNRFFGGTCKPYRDDVHPSKFTPFILQKRLEKYFILDELKTIDMGISQCCLAIKPI